MRNDSFWLQDARVLVDCAMGRSPADLVIRDGQWVCVQTGEVIPPSWARMPAIPSARGRK